MKIIADANIPFVNECFSSIGSVKIVPGREINSAILADANVLLVRSITEVTKDLLENSSVKFVATATIGTDHIDTDYLAKNNIGFAAAAGSNDNSVAEYAVAAMLQVSQKQGLTLAGKSIGIVGVGNVGSRIEKKCAALGMDIFLNDPPLQRKSGDPKYLPLENVLGCDFVTLHTPLTYEGIDKTYHLADEKFFNSLKPGCVFINTSRGAVVKTSALKGAMEKNIVSAVILDVWENEPNIDIELLKNVDIATPHIAGYSFDGKVAGMIMIYNAVCEHFGLEKKYNVDDFLPEPQVAVITVDSVENDEDVLREIIAKVYDIRSDNNRMRKMADLAEDKSGEFFDGLRKDYPVRREFQNTEVIVKSGETSSYKKRGIGFRVTDGR